MISGFHNSEGGVDPPPCSAHVSEPVERSHPSGFPTIPTNRLVEQVRLGAHHTAVGLHKLLGDRICSVGILMYHRVAERPSGMPAPSFNVTPAELRSQLEGVLERGFRPWPLPKLVQAIHLKQSLPKRIFVVTFDDGYENNYLDALPILEDLGISATIFLSTAYLGSKRPFPFDDWTCAGAPDVPAKSWRPLSINQCRELASHELIDLGAHTHTHDLFVDKLAEFRADLLENLRVLKENFGVSRPVFAFPFGVFSREMISVVKQLEIAGAATTRPFPVSAATDPFAMGRYAADQFDTSASLAAKLAGWYTPITNVLRAIRKPLSALTPGGIGVPVSIAHSHHDSSHKA